MSPKQKFILAAFGGALIAQAGVLTNLAYTTFGVANTADTLLSIVKKHADTLSADDLQTLQNITKKYS